MKKKWKNNLKLKYFLFISKSSLHVRWCAETYANYWFYVYPKIVDFLASISERKFAMHAYALHLNWLNLELSSIGQFRGYS